MVASDNLYDRAVGKHAAVFLLALSKSAVVYNGSVGRGILKHDDAVASQMNAEVSVGNSFGFIINGQEDITACLVASKAKAGAKIVNI